MFCCLMMTVCIDQTHTQAHKPRQWTAPCTACSLNSSFRHHLSQFGAKTIWSILVSVETHARILACRFSGVGNTHSTKRERTHTHTHTRTHTRTHLKNWKKKAKKAQKKRKKKKLFRNLYCNNVEDWIVLANLIWALSALCIQLLQMLHLLSVTIIPAFPYLW